MINVSDRLTAKTVENILTEAKEIYWEKGDENATVENTVAHALNDLDGKVAILAAGVAMKISTNPTVIYKSSATTVTITGTLENAADAESKSMSLYSGSSTTAIATSTGTTVTGSTTVNTTSNNITYTVKGQVNGMSLTPKTATLNARYPMYVGIGPSYEDIATITYRLGPTTTAGTQSSPREYSVTATTAGHFFLLVPTDITNPTTFVSGGAPVDMQTTTEQINGISYKVNKTGGTYAVGTQLKITAS